MPQSGNKVCFRSSGRDAAQAERALFFLMSGDVILEAGEESITLLLRISLS